MKNDFIKRISDLGIEVSDLQLEKFETYFKLLIEWNNKINLTAITEEHEVYVKHFYDSICLVKAIDINDQTLLDVGSGAGFPSIPLKILFPSLKVTIIDALAKRINFLDLLVKELDITVELIHGRAEEYSQKNSYDLVTARAVANLRVLSELCIPFVKKDGYFLALKGPKHIEEIEQSQNAFKILGGKLIDTIVYTIDDQERSIIKVLKIKPTNMKYPRMFSKIKKSPL
jgi:16S rRNA (guanine527-N7)-methyltransferase